jgi:hypothetical protein
VQNDKDAQRSSDHNKKGKMNVIIGGTSTKAGPVVIPRSNDVILGRGNGISNWPGNIAYRHIVWSHRDAYQCSMRNDKQNLARKVVADVYSLDPPGRFIECNLHGDYQMVSFGTAMEKASQALRERRMSKPQGYNPKAMAAQAAKNKQKAMKMLRCAKAMVQLKENNQKPPTSDGASKSGGLLARATTAPTTATTSNTINKLAGPKPIPTNITVAKWNEAPKKPKVAAKKAGKPNKLKISKKSPATKPTVAAIKAISTNLKVIKIEDTKPKAAAVPTKPKLVKLPVELKLPTTPKRAKCPATATVAAPLLQHVKTASYASMYTNRYPAPPILTRHQGLHHQAVFNLNTAMTRMPLMTRATNMPKQQQVAPQLPHQVHEMLPLMPPHLKAFFSGIFPATPEKPAISDSFATAKNPFGFHNTVFGDRDIAGSPATVCIMHLLPPPQLKVTHSLFRDDDNVDMDAFDVPDDAPTTVCSTKKNLFPPPPPLEPSHSLFSLDDESVDMVGMDADIIEAFDPVEAWNAFAVHKKKQW